MSEQLELSIELPASTQGIYTAWLDNASHAASPAAQRSSMRGSAGASPAWDGYVSGETLALEPYTRILQSWRTA